MDDSFVTSGSDFDSSADSGRQNGLEVPIPPTIFSRNFSRVTGNLIWSYRFFHPNGDTDFTGDLFSIVHVLGHPRAQIQPEKWSSSQNSAFKSLSPEASYEVHQSVRCAVPIEQLARSVYIQFEPFSNPEHDLVGLLMGTELVQHVQAHADVKNLYSLFACYYLSDGHNRCEYYLTMIN